MLHATIISVPDGDSLVVRWLGCGECVVDMALIDAPEMRQNYGRLARSALVRLSGGRGAQIVLRDVTPSQGAGAPQRRHVRARVYQGSVDINRFLVKVGLAWARTGIIDSPLWQLEMKAREAERGFWWLPPAERIPPWMWREQRDRRRRMGRARP